MKKTLISSLVAVMTATAANASGFYVSPKIAYGTLSADETRVEKQWSGETWAAFDGNKTEAWDNKDRRITPKFAVGYDFSTEKYGFFGIEAEYSHTEYRFDEANAYVDFEGNTPNDSGDARHITYADTTISLNAKYGYNIKDIITPFVRAGIGLAAIDSENTFRSGTYWWDTRANEDNFAWNIGAGLELPVAKNVAITLEYTYTDLGKVEYSNWLNHEKGTSNGTERHFDSKVDLSKHELAAGVKIMF